MSLVENTSALKIQKAYRKYYESKDSCPICLKTIGLDSCITKCGHKFCTGCLLQSIQNINTCPLCRNELVQKSDTIEEEEEVDYISAELQEGYDYGYYAFEEELRLNIRQHINISRYPNSVRNAQNLSSEIISIFREELDIAKQKAFEEGLKVNREQMIEIIYKKVNEIEERHKKIIKYGEKQMKPIGQRGIIDGLDFDDPSMGFTDEDYKDYCVEEGIQWWI